MLISGFRHHTRRPSFSGSRSCQRCLEDIQPAGTYNRRDLECTSYLRRWWSLPDHHNQTGYSRFLSCPDWAQHLDRWSKWIQIVARYFRLRRRGLQVQIYLKDTALRTMANNKSSMCVKMRQREKIGVQDCLSSHTSFLREISDRPKTGRALRFLLDML